MNFELKFNVHGSVHRNSSLKKSNEMQQYADIYLLLNYCTCFGRPSRPSSGVHKTSCSFFKHGQVLSCSHFKKLVPQIVGGCKYSFMYS